jgi:hypothetical protein
MSKPGFFKMVAPKKGIILSDEFRDNLVGKQVRPVDPLLSIGFTDKEHPRRADWEIKLKIPQKHVGQVMRAYEGKPKGVELDVDVLITSQAEAGTFRAKLKFDKIAKQANPQKDDAQDAEPSVLAWARIEARYKLTESLLAELRSSGVPDATIVKLEPLKDRVFESRDSFLRELGRTLGEEERKHEHQILEHACRDDIPLDMQIPPALLLSNVVVHTRIRCGNAAMGYSLFYGVYEFLYEKVIFPLSWR